MKYQALIEQLRIPMREQRAMLSEQRLVPRRGMRCIGSISLRFRWEIALLR